MVSDKQTIKRLIVPAAHIIFVRVPGSPFATVVYVLPSIDVKLSIDEINPNSDKVEDHTAIIGTLGVFVICVNVFPSVDLNINRFEGPKLARISGLTVFAVDAATKETTLPPILINLS